MVYFTHIGNIKKIYKINEETKPDKNQQVGTENKIVVTKGVGVGQGEMGKGDQLYGDRWKLKFWW